MNHSKFLTALVSASILTLGTTLTVGAVGTEVENVQASKEDIRAGLTDLRALRKEVRVSKKAARMEEKKAQAEAPEATEAVAEVLTAKSVAPMSAPEVENPAESLEAPSTWEETAAATQEETVYDDLVSSEQEVSDAYEEDAGYDSISESDPSEAAYAYEEEENTVDEWYDEESIYEEEPVYSEVSEEETASRYSASGSDLDLLAAIIQCEAGGESYEGKVAVGAVVLNRMDSSLYPDSMSEVIYQPWQFTPAMTGNLESVLASGARDDCYEAAQAALEGENPVGDCLYFHAGGGSGLTIGNQTFY